VQLGLRAGEHRGGIGLAAEGDGHGARGELRVGEVERDARVGVERILLDASDYANDCLPRISCRELDDVDALADGILSGPELLGHVFVDDDGDGAGEVVVVVEEASAAQRNFHGFEVVSGDDALVGVEKFFAGQRDAAFDGDWSPGEGFAQGE